MSAHGVVCHVLGSICSDGIIYTSSITLISRTLSFQHWFVNKISWDIFSKAGPGTVKQKIFVTPQIEIWVMIIVSLKVKHLLKLRTWRLMWSMLSDTIQNVVSNGIGCRAWCKLLNCWIHCALGVVFIRDTFTGEIYFQVGKVLSRLTSFVLFSHPLYFISVDWSYSLSLNLGADFIQ